MSPRAGTSLSEDTSAGVGVAADGDPRRGRGVVALEVILGVSVVVLNVPPVSPTFSLLGLLALSSLLRRQGLSSVGLVRPERFARLAGTILLLAVGWTIVNLALIMPALEHATGQQKDFGQFAGLQGDPAALVALLVLSWTLAAFGEELGYRGWLFTRVRELVGSERVAVATALVVTSALFGWAHAEQGLIGVVMTGIDAAFWCVLRIRFGTLWAPILAHGFNNTIGLTAFFLVGPITGWW